MLRSPFKKSKKDKASANPGGGPSDSETTNIQAMLGDYELPTFPTLVAQALEELGDPAADMAHVASIIERDPGASARLLKLVNSTTFAPRSTVTSVHQGAMMLGRNQLESLLISIGARGVLPNPASNGFEQRRFWTAASKRAILAGLIAEQTDPTRRSQNFTAALLQDMALPVLALRTDEYGEVLEHWHNSDEDLAELEENTFGWHHGTVASFMGDQWNFPKEFVGFMHDHHEHSQSDVLHPARVVAPIKEVGSRPDEQLIDEAPDELDISSDDLVAMVDIANSEAMQLADMMG